MPRIILFIALAFVACDATPPPEPAQPAEDTPTPRQAGYCGPVVPPEPMGMVDAGVIARVEALPYYASTALDLPNGDEVLGNALLTVTPDGKVLLRLTTTDVDLRRTVFAQLDLTATLEQEKGYMFAEVDGSSQPFGSISINGESGLFLQGTLLLAKLEVHPSGIFALELEPTKLGTWPPETQIDPELEDVIEELAQTIHVVGRLHGSCMQTLQNGAQARLMDITDRPQCAELLAYL